MNLAFDVSYKFNSGGFTELLEATEYDNIVVGNALYRSIVYKNSVLI